MLRYPGGLLGRFPAAPVRIGDSVSLVGNRRRRATHRGVALSDREFRATSDCTARAVDGDAAVWPVPRIEYGSLLLLIACVSSFARAARMDGRSPLVWGGLSLGSWIVFTQHLVEGLEGACLSQLALFAGLTAAAIARDRRSARRIREQAGGALESSRSSELMPSAHAPAGQRAET